MAIKITKTPENGYKYVVQSERGKSDAFTVYIKPINTRTLLGLEDRMVQRKGDDVFIAQGEFAFRIAQFGILGWENMLDEKNKPVAFELDADGVATEKTIAHIPADLLTEISGVVNAITRNPSSIFEVFFPTED